MSASRCSSPPVWASPLPRRTDRTLASGPCGPGEPPSIISIARSSFRAVEAVVRIAPEPSLAWFGGSDHRVPRLHEVRRRMPVRTEVAAAGPSARQALPEMFPAAADLNARRAHIERSADVADEGGMVACASGGIRGGQVVLDHAGTLPRGGRLDSRRQKCRAKQRAVAALRPNRTPTRRCGGRHFRVGRAIICAKDAADIGAPRKNWQVVVAGTLQVTTFRKAYPITDGGTGGRDRRPLARRPDGDTGHPWSRGHRRHRAWRAA